MKKIMLVLKNEFLGVVTRKSFLLTLILIPVTSFIVLMVITGIQKKTGADASAALQNLFMPPVQETVEGFVDQSGLMKAIPAGFEGKLIPYTSEPDALIAVNEGRVDAYYLIPQDYLETGNIIYVRPDFNPLGGSNQSSAIKALTAYNLADGDE